MYCFMEDRQPWGFPRCRDEYRKKGRRALLNQLYRLTQGASEMVSVIQEHVAASGSQLLRAGVNSSGNYVAFIAPKPYECDNRLEAHAWVHRVVYATGKRNIRETGRSPGIYAGAFGIRNYSLGR
nr:hypothetical protein [Escherichia coli]